MEPSLKACLFKGFSINVGACKINVLFYAWLLKSKAKQQIQLHTLKALHVTDVALKVGRYHKVVRK